MRAQPSSLNGRQVRHLRALAHHLDPVVIVGKEGVSDAVIRAASVRARPIALTALAAMTGAFFILDDPIFNGLAVSLIFGILVSTVLTLVVIPLLYYIVLKRARDKAIK